MNDYQFELFKVQGDFVWHDHQSTDEVFAVLDGQLSIEFRPGRDWAHLARIALDTL